MMWNRRYRTRRAPGRRTNARRIIPLLDGVESRLLLAADGFLQGTVFVDTAGTHRFDPLAGDTPQAGATVELIQNNVVLKAQTTGSDGSYRFTGLAAGTYQLTEIPPSGYAGDGTQIDSPLNPAAASAPSTITVQVEDLSNVSYIYNEVYQYSSLEPSVVQFRLSTDGGSTYATQLLTIGQMPVTVTYPTGPTTQATTPQFASYCVQPDSTLNYGVDTVKAYASPLGSALVPPANAGAIGYLYEQYGSVLAQPPASLSQAYNLQALQLAIWKLQYDTGPNLATFSGGNLKDLSIETQYNNYESVKNDPSLADLENRAIGYIQEGLNYSAPAIELVATSGTNGTQDLLAPEILNFGNAPGGVATSVAYASDGQPISGPVAVGTSVYDTATVAPTAGGPTPTGTVTYNVYDTSSPTYGVTTPIATDTETLTTSGAVPNSAPFQPQAPGSYAYIAVYSGDGNYGISVGQPETFAVDQATPTITTQASETGNVVGVATLTDTATLSGGYQPGGTITFTLTGPDGKAVALPPADQSVAVSGDAGYTTPVPVLATEVGTYTWHATYSGDANNAGASDDGKNEGVTTVQASPSLSTIPGGPVALRPSTGITIEGTKYLDSTGNGYSPSTESGQGGVTIDLYNTSWSLVAKTTTAGDGSYSFTGLAPATYYVRESVPQGYIQTGGGPNGSAGNTYYTINAQPGYSYSRNDFADFQTGTCSVTNVCYTVTTPSGCSQTYTSLGGHTAPGDTVTVNFSVPQGSSETVTLVSYYAPSSSFSDSNAYLQTIDQQATGTFGPGPHSLTVKLPCNDYQVDFVCGSAINQLDPTQNNDAYGPDSAELLYHAQGRFIDSDNGGYSVATPYPSNPNPATPTNPTTTKGSPSASSPLGDSASLTGTYNGTGTITFYLFAPNVTPNADDSNNIFTDTVAVSGDGTYTTAVGSTTGSALPTVAGTYEWVVVYSGDASNQGALSAFGSESEVVVNVATPTIATTPNVTSVTLGTGAVVLKDTATLSGGNDPTGTITFTLYAPDGKTVLDTEQVDVAGDGHYTTPTGYTLPSNAATGVYQWDATYSGDAENTEASDLNDPSEQVTVVPSSPVTRGDFATIGFWHNKNGQAVIESFNGGPTSTQLGNWLATNFPNLFGGKNAYLPSSLAGMTNAQVAKAYENLWTPSGSAKNTYVQAFAVALGIYADSASLGYDGTAGSFGFKEVNVGGGSLTFNVGSNGSALGVPNNTSLTVSRILALADGNFNAATGTFSGGDSSKTGALNNLLNGINTTGDIG